MNENSRIFRGTRRDFLADALKGACLYASTPLIASILAGCGDGSPVQPAGDTPIQIDISTSAFQPLATVGGVVTVDPGDVSGLSGKGVFIIRDSDTSVVVLDRTCTHQGCQVDAFAENGIATCPCHGSRFSTTGSVVNGPAASPLRRYAATLTGNLIDFTV